MKNFNFYNFLTDNGYQREKVRDSKGLFFANNYQKEIEPNIWNCLTVHSDKTISAASPKEGLFLINGEQPKSEEEAKELLKKLEIV